MIPFLTHFNKPRKYIIATVQYNDTGQKLDIWGKFSPAQIGRAPVLMFIPGGAWMVGYRRGQGYALMSHLVEQGWICVAIDYRTAPRNKWPIPFMDVCQALLWVRANIDAFGGNPDFVAMAGASAGGHMASLAGLAGGDDSPDAVVSLYGVYDWTYRGSLYHQGFGRILEALIVGKRQDLHPLLFRDSSPIWHIRPDAPPFFIIHGTSDWLTPVGGARRFYRELSAVSEAPVNYLQIPGAVHGFDLVHPRQTELAVAEIERFLTSAWEASLQRRVS